MIFLNEAFVIEIHDRVILPSELQGLAKNKNLGASLERVHHRVQYGLIKDIFELASCYAMVIAQGHCFNDANKRTAFAVASLLLKNDGIYLKAPTDKIGQQIILLASKQIDEHNFAQFLKDNCLIK